MIFLVLNKSIRKLNDFMLIFYLLMLFSCNAKNPSIEEDIVTEKTDKKQGEQLAIIKTIRLVNHSFNQELLSNGKLEALQKINLKFMADGVISQINVRENQTVSKGATLAVLDKAQQQRSYNQSRLRYQQANLDYEDQLLRLGFRLSDTSQIDKNTKTIARIRSGLANAELELQKAKADLASTNLIAPFSGKVANLKGKAYGNTGGTEYFCTLINDSELTVEFLVLEQEIDFIRKCKTVLVNPFNNETKSYNGAIVSINPTIDKSGMISVKARVQNTDGQLMDGMGVKIKAQMAIANQLVIPKSALLERQGRKVVFTRTGNTAYWNYVEVAYENSNQYAIKSGLKVGDEVIYEGNFNLAHDSPVKVANHP